MQQLMQEFPQNNSTILYMNVTDLFGKWWSINRQNKRRRHKNFSSLSTQEQDQLIVSFFEEGWHELFCRNHIDESLDYVYNKYGINLIDMKIKILKNNRIFVIDRKIWKDIERVLMEYSSILHPNLIFSGINIRVWGRRDQCVVISKMKEKNV